MGEAIAVGWDARGRGKKGPLVVVVVVLVVVVAAFVGGGSTCPGASGNSSLCSAVVATGAMGYVDTRDGF